MQLTDRLTTLTCFDKENRSNRTPNRSNLKQIKHTCWTEVEAPEKEPDGGGGAGKGAGRRWRLLVTVEHRGV
ncbi:hypothetical protein HanRHA438_Chr15g0685261 [Helianthus annuus]|nr:hypothetical protein HanRHA438_Chr15g0685261 [Helianthus annuus]